VKTDNPHFDVFLQNDDSKYSIFDVTTSQPSHLVDVLDPNLDFLDRSSAIDLKNSFDQGLQKINSVFSPRAPLREGQASELSFDSSSTVRKLKKQQPKKMPFYFRESLPSRKLDAAMNLVSGLPESADRPPAEVLDKKVINLYK
jgi:hypothetical protein